MNLRPFLFFALLAVTLVACTSGGLFSDDCGENTCGACQEGFDNVVECVDGDWSCSCVPSGKAPASSNVDAGPDTTPDAPQPVLTCQQKLANPSASGVCPADEWDEPCEQGCLSCRCLAGTWGACTTSASCFDAGTD